MTVQERKHALIHWLTEVEDEKVIEKIESVQKAVDQIPERIEQLLVLSMQSEIADCTTHTSIKAMLR
ncbi:MAG: hypothetical protein Q8J69_05635 [Sphingobacteriaceae bacterium]|nr:hypothetical protein [Sphingobacteriaceae bacterium]